MKLNTEYIYFTLEPMSYTDLDLSTAQTRSLNSSNESQSTLSVINTLTATANVLQKEIVEKNVSIEKLTSKVKEQELEIAVLKDKLTLLQNTNATGDVAASKEAIKAISKTLGSLYSSLDPDEQFDVCLGYGLPRNVRVRNNLRAILQESHPERNDSEIRAAIQNRFKTESKAYKENQLPGEQRDKVRKRRLLTSRRQSVYKTRLATAVKTNKHVDIMRKSTEYDMSDLEDCEDGFICKVPTWRSQELTAALRELDGLVTSKRKARKYGSPSKRSRK